jgi:hypothetical protein
MAREKKINFRASKAEIAMLDDLGQFTRRGKSELIRWIITSYHKQVFGKKPLPEFKINNE